MSDIYIFRGKSATGKTTISNYLSRKLGIPVLRKDDIYDAASVCCLSHETLNDISNKVLTKMIQTNIDLKQDLIVDIALPHKPYALEFFKGIHFKDSKVHYYLCTCSDEQIWRERIKKRAQNPLPNQIFKSASQALLHYSGFDFASIDDEITLDSANDLEGIFKIIVSNK